MGEAQDTRGDRGGDDDEEAATSAATTARPQVASSVLAKRIEASGHLSTTPPEPTFEMLRDSCRAMRVADRALEAIDVEWDPEKIASDLEKKR